MDLVFIASPLNPKNQWKRSRDLYFAEQYAHHIHKMGQVLALCPHSVLASFWNEFREGVLFEKALELVRRSDACFCVPGWLEDTNAKAQVFQAKALKVPTFERLPELSDWLALRKIEREG